MHTKTILRKNDFCCEKYPNPTDSRRQSCSKYADLLNEDVVQNSVQEQCSQHDVEPPLHFPDRCQNRKIDL